MTDLPIFALILISTLSYTMESKNVIRAGVFSTERCVEGVVPGANGDVVFFRQGWRLMRKEWTIPSTNSVRALPSQSWRKLRMGARVDDQVLEWLTLIFRALYETWNVWNWCYTPKNIICLPFFYPNLKIPSWVDVVVVVGPAAAPLYKITSLWPMVEKLGKANT